MVTNKNKIDALLQKRDSESTESMQKYNDKTGIPPNMQNDKNVYNPRMIAFILFCFLDKDKYLLIPIETSLKDLQCRNKCIYNAIFDPYTPPIILTGSIFRHTSINNFINIFIHSFIHIRIILMIYPSSVHSAHKKLKLYQAIPLYCTNLYH